MTSISPSETAQEVLAQCLEGRPPAKLPPCLLEERAAPALFSILVEGLADRFEPGLCDAYAHLFSQALADVDPAWDANSLFERYQRVRRPRPVKGEPRRVFVLSRITLGADVAVTSVLMAAAKQRFPRAEILFAGPRKNYELFVADPRIRHALVNYRRGSLAERLAAVSELRQIIGTERDVIVIDPDSRLTQLGLVPINPEEHYYFFESRSYGAESGRNLPELAADWAREALGIADTRPFVALGPAVAQPPQITVSLGVGDNPAKRIPDPFESELLALLGRTRMSILIDRGAGGEESARVEGAIHASGVQATVWDGSFAGFARHITASGLYAGYDSAGQHVAAACGVPLISIFAGFPAPRMFDRWRPKGEGCHVIRVERPEPAQTLARVRDALATVR